MYLTLLFGGQAFKNDYKELIRDAVDKMLVPETRDMDLSNDFMAIRSFDRSGHNNVFRI